MASSSSGVAILADALGPALEQVIARKIEGSDLFLPGTHYSGSLGSLVGKLVGQLLLVISQLTLALARAAIIDAISGSTQRPTAGGGVADQGSGKKWTAYIKHGLSLSIGQKESLAKAIVGGTSSTLCISSDPLEGPNMLMLTQIQA